MIIEFIPSSKDVERFVNYPEVASKSIPDWYKEIKNDVYKELKFKNQQVVNKNLKMCMPFLDAFTTGYIQKTWCDIQIENNNGIVTYTYPVDPHIIDHRDSINISIDNMFYKTEFVWKTPWVPKLPKGYSCLFTHPLNQIDLPFITLSGVIDSDLFFHTPFGNIPFYIKNNFSGTIPCGTPMYQIIPFKRENWEKKILNFNEEKTKKNMFFMNKKFISNYKNNFWQKKNFK